MLTAQDYNDVSLALSDLFITLVTQCYLTTLSIPPLNLQGEAGIHRGCGSMSHRLLGWQGWSEHTHVGKTLTLSAYQDQLHSPVGCFL